MFHRTGTRRQRAAGYAGTSRFQGGTFPTSLWCCIAGPLQGVEGPLRCQHHTLRNFCFSSATVCVSKMLKTRVYATLFSPVAKPIGSRKPVVVYRFSGIGNVSNMLPSLIAGPGKFGSNFFARFRHTSRFARHETVGRSSVAPNGMAMAGKSMCLPATQWHLLMPDEPNALGSATTAGPCPDASGPWLLRLLLPVVHHQLHPGHAPLLPLARGPEGRTG